MGDKKKPSDTYTDPDMDKEYEAIEEEERKTRKPKKVNRSLKVNEEEKEQEIKTTEDDLYNKIYRTEKYKTHLDSAIFKEIMNADKNLIEDLQELIEGYGMKFVGETKKEVATEMSAWLIDKYKYDPDTNDAMMIRNDIDLTFSETNPRLMQVLEKRAIVGKAYSELTDYEKPASQKLEEFEKFIGQKKETLSKGRDTAFEKFMRDIGMKIATKVGLKDFAEQTLFKVHGKEFVKEVLPENRNNSKPGKK